MKWTDLARRVAERSGESHGSTRRVLDALLEEIADGVVAGDAVSLPRVGRLSCAWREPSTVRSLEDGRKRMVGGRYVPRFRASGILRERLAAKSSQSWRTPEHQAAWRAAEALIGDLALYHADLIPTGLGRASSEDEVERRCAESFGAHWDRARAAFAERAPGVSEPYLARSARRRWAP